MKLKQRLAEYKRTMEHKHGWEVELECPECGYRGLPSHNGWTPRYPMGFGATPPYSFPSPARNADTTSSRKPRPCWWKCSPASIYRE